MIEIDSWDAIADARLRYCAAIYVAHAAILLVSGMTGAALSDDLDDDEQAAAMMAVATTAVVIACRLRRRVI